MQKEMSTLLLLEVNIEITQAHTTKKLNWLGMQEEI